MEKNSIRVSTGAKRIEVNDHGEYIVLNFNDHSFPDRFFSMLDRVESRCDAAKAEEEKIREQVDPGSTEFIRAVSAFDHDLHRYIAAEVDSVLGENTCRKVFGDIVPGVELFEDFFSQLQPYFEKFSKERSQKMSKYSADRTANG